MATIEELERQFHGKLSIIDGTLLRFHENLGRIGSIIGKDPTYVYELLHSRFEQLKEDFSAAVNMNEGVLNSLISRADKIISVLEEVNYVMTRIEESEDNEAIDVKNEASEIINNLAENIESRLADEEKPYGTFNLMGYLIPGIATFVLLKYGLKQSTTVSLVASGAVAIIMGGNSAKAIEDKSKVDEGDIPPMITA